MIDEFTAYNMLRDIRNIHDGMFSFINDEAVKQDKNGTPISTITVDKKIMDISRALNRLMAKYSPTKEVIDLSPYPTVSIYMTDCGPVQIMEK